MGKSLVRQIFLLVLLEVDVTWVQGVKQLVFWLSQTKQPHVLDSLILSGNHGVGDDIIELLVKGLPQFPNKLTYIGIAETAVIIEGLCILISAVVRAPDFVLNEWQNRYLRVQVSTDYWAWEAAQGDDCGWNIFRRRFYEAKGADDSIWYRAFERKCGGDLPVIVFWRCTKECAEIPAKTYLKTHSVDKCK